MSGMIRNVIGPSVRFDRPVMEARLLPKDEIPLVKPPSIPESEVDVADEMLLSGISCSSMAAASVASAARR